MKYTSKTVSSFYNEILNNLIMKNINVKKNDNKKYMALV